MMKNFQKILKKSLSFRTHQGQNCGFKIDIDDELTILVHPYYNKMNSFTEIERKELGLEGLLPWRVEDLDLQVKRAYTQLQEYKKDIHKYIFLSNLQQRNAAIFYRLLKDHLVEICPIVYTPTVGEACQRFSSEFRSSLGLFLNYEMRGRVSEVLENWKLDPDIIVMTDGSRILGLGDLGVNGMGIPIGKLSLYVAAGGFHPAHTLPIMIDVGTNNEELLEDPFYFGLSHPRIRGDDFYEFMDEVMEAIEQKWPQCIIQFEDFSNDVCFDMLDRYRYEYSCFNDDIQGTGSVITSGVIKALDIVTESGKLSSVEDQRFLFYGAGSAAVGVSDQIQIYLQDEFELTEDQTRKQFFFVDSKGLISSDRDDLGGTYKMDLTCPALPTTTSSLEDIVRSIKPNFLIGLSGDHKSFNKEVIGEMAKNNKIPVIMALSNPTSKCECTAEEAYKYSEERAIFASGTGFPDYETSSGSILRPGQGNNMYIFPGLGLGASISKARVITESMVTQAAKSLSEQVSEDDLSTGTIYPDLNRIREISKKIAYDVAIKALKEGVSHYKMYETVNFKEKIEFFTYKPEYREYIK